MQHPAMTRCPHCGHALAAPAPHDAAAELAQRLRQAGHTVTLGGLVTERAAAEALGMAAGSLRNRSCYGTPILEPVVVNRRRWYRIADLAALLHGSA